MSKECHDCRRSLPDSEPTTGGKCRICSRMDWRKAGRISTPSLPPVVYDSSAKPCTECGGKRDSSCKRQSMCKSCMATYAYQRRHKRHRPIKKVKKKDYHRTGPQPARLERERIAAMPGVDIDHIHKVWKNR